MQAMAARAGNTQTMQITCPAPILRGVLFAWYGLPQGIPSDGAGAAGVQHAGVASKESHLLQRSVSRVRSSSSFSGCCPLARDRRATSQWVSGRYRRRREQ